MSTFTKLRVSCKTNYDYEGLFDKEITEETMKDLGYEIKNWWSWMEYPLSHIFIEDDIPETIFEAFAKEPACISMTIRNDNGDDVLIVKER